jgi:5-methylthioadenosine/S-adenosylhomocysteine deaminase
MDAPAIAEAAILIGADGRITAIGPDHSVPSPTDAVALEFGDAILLPGLVNAHTHLELTGFPEQTEGVDFRQWILGIRALKEARSHADFLAASRAGIEECWAAGVTTVADTGDSGAVLEALAELGGSGIVYHEVFGPDPDQVERSFSDLEDRLRRLSFLAGGRIRIGVSPHAPYTVSGPLYARVAEWAKAEELPIAVHVAESPAESEFVARGTGPFAEGWKSRGIPLLDDPSHQPPRRPAIPPSSAVGWLDRLGVLGPDTLCIHAIQLSPEDIATLAVRGSAVAHCPVSNARHGHGNAPLAALRRAGIRVGLGTDSVASVGRLDLLAEARAARMLAGLSAGEALALCTLESARALRLEAEIGSLTPRKWGDVTVIEPPGGQFPARGDPAERALASGLSDVLLTVLGGRLVYRRDGAA